MPWSCVTTRTPYLFWGITGTIIIIDTNHIRHVCHHAYVCTIMTLKSAQPDKPIIEFGLHFHMLFAADLFLAPTLMYEAQFDKIPSRY